MGQNFNGYRLVADEGGIFDFGLLFSGSLANTHLNAPIVGIAVTDSGEGYWMVGADGGVFTYGDAPFLGSIYTAIDLHRHRRDPAERPHRWDPAPGLGQPPGVSHATR